MTLRSMFSAVSGLQNHQTRIDVIGNNISNVNTVGYKSGRVTFQDVFSQTIRSAGANSGTTGGTNPVQIGLGSQIGDHRYSVYAREFSVHRANLRSGNRRRWLFCVNKSVEFGRNVLYKGGKFRH